jgi:hypothetical protein
MTGTLAAVEVRRRRRSPGLLGLPWSRYAQLEQAHTGDLQKRRYTNLAGAKQGWLDKSPRCVYSEYISIFARIPDCFPLSDSSGSQVRS